ncbi:rab GTPase-binding effector protein 2-like [Salvelinus fontinalis]|uniref:rab GTPase-binding effector protein 2-like n=1 Tax=Salvelinus fontinalis TaxID=8038 RepID=UPI002486A456|nr:rab GTPase-binding effector protein 2-like [Salvelinus fontinalis]
MIMEPSGNSQKDDTGAMESLQAQLADCRAQLEHWQGVATICELSKQEELGELQRQCDQEMQSLQEALRETASQYEARISTLQSERAQWRRASVQSQGSVKKDGVEAGAMQSEGQSTDSPTNSLREPRTDGWGSQPGEAEGPGEGEGAGLEGYFSQNCDFASFSSFSLATPSLPRRQPPQEDTASLVSTGTLVPEAIYLPPPGHRLVTHTEWDSLNTQVVELEGELSRLREERTELESELDTQTTETHKHVSVLQSQVQTSEALLQELQKSFNQSQNAIHSRLAELSLSQRRVCNELSRLKGEEIEETFGAGDANTHLGPTLQGAHSEERLRIEIVNLKEQLETRVEESEVLQVQLSSLKTEMERVQCQKETLQVELQNGRTELQGLSVALSHLQGDSKTLSHDKVSLQQRCLELRSQIVSMRSQVDTSQMVQRDFVQLSQSLQVKLELIRQAETLDQVRDILEEGLPEEGAPPTDAT